MELGWRWVVFVALVGCTHAQLKARDLSDVLAVHPLAKDVPASSVMSPEPQPWKVGQWALYKRIVHSETDYLRNSIVAEDACGIWLDEVSESIYHRDEVLSCWRAMPKPFPPEQAIELLQVVIFKLDDTVVFTLDFRNHPEQRQKWREFAVERANPWFAQPVPCPTLIGRPVQVDSNPPGANVYVGNKHCPIGKTPWSGAFPDDVNTVIVEMPGYAPVAKTIDASIFVDLQPLAEPASSTPPEIPREDVEVPAGKFASAYRSENGYRTRITWFSPEVPISGEVKARSKDLSVELISYGQDGAPSVIPSLAESRSVPSYRPLGFFELALGNATLGRSRLEDDANGYGGAFTVGLHIPEHPLDVVLGARAIVGLPYSPDKTMQQTSNEVLVGVRWRPLRRGNSRRVDWTAFYLQGALGFGWLSRDNNNVASGLAGSGAIEWLPYVFRYGGFGLELSETYMRFDALEEGRNQTDALLLLHLEN